MSLLICEFKSKTYKIKEYILVEISRIQLSISSRKDSAMVEI